ncbi:HTH-type transcriptional activator CmpR [uncultured Roseburia sp.]|uniref:LysR family transcriptional regulator n=1 Tax=Brotonthovivens ammoniilytica TaxID=2981725 RepID=A0ABT2TM29_9FIRM|nr:LysR family transcriptional regulator [Brotonthovivens ammoniilytica]MCU6762736.1 LysR family transcriptional regulator [Brotonthovivens ammoniilytica]SCI86581.1 HTH-type transcriptional activator CmpR [uncultured Roseburia sp.]
MVCDYALSAVTVQQIQIFLQLARTKNFTRTADSLNMTQPGVSKSIASLEAALGFSLFERTSRKVALTPEGRILYETWLHIPADLDNGYQTARQENARIASVLNIGITDTTDSLKYFWPVAREFAKAFPDIKLNVESENMKSLQSRLAEGIYDLIFLPDFEHYSLDKNKICWKYAAKSNVQIIVLTDSPLSRKSMLTMEDIINKKVTALDPESNPNFLHSLRELYAQYGKEPVLGQLYRSNFQIRYAQMTQDCIHITDDFWSYTPDTVSRKIPLMGHFNGIICAWNPEISKASLKNFLGFIPSDR